MQMQMPKHSLTRPLRTIILGAPGSGKGTLSSRLTNNLSPHLETVSTGDVLRKQIKEGTRLGQQASEYIKAGKLLPDSTITQVLESEFVARNWVSPTSSPSWLLDGFPRTLSQAKALDHFLSRSKNTQLNLVVHLDVPFSVILERIENRWVHIPSGRVYNLTYNPPKVAGKDDMTGEPLSKRPDDNPETFKKRLESYQKATEPIIDYYKSKQDKPNSLVITVSGPTSDIIYPKLEAEVVSRFCSPTSSSGGNPLNFNFRESL